jgi:hypothetical protein
VIESGNRVLRLFFNKIRIAEKQLNMDQAVERAVYEKHCCTGSKSASSYELWLERPPRDPSSSSPLRAAFVAKRARYKLYKALRNGNRNYTDDSPGQFDRFYREKGLQHLLPICFGGPQYIHYYAQQRPQDCGQIKRNAVRTSILGSIGPRKMRYGRLRHL